MGGKENTENEKEENEKTKKCFNTFLKYLDM